MNIIGIESKYLNPTWTELNWNKWIDLSPVCYGKMYVISCLNPHSHVKICHNTFVGWNRDDNHKKAYVAWRAADVGWKCMGDNIK